MASLSELLLGDLNLDDSTGLSDLPQPAIVRIMRFLDASDRVGSRSSCALVCSSWAEAAAEATDSIVLQQGCIYIASFEQWLNNHGSNLTKLHITSYVPLFLTALPCIKLQDLLLHDDNLFIASNPRLPQMLAALPNLQTLSLGASTHNNATNWAQWGPGRRPAKMQPLGVVPANLLQHLPHVTRLQLSDGVRDAALLHSSSLTSCSHLVLQQPQWVTPTGLAGVWELHRFTHLELSGLECGLTRNTARGLSRLTALQHLHLAWKTLRWDAYALQPSQLTGMTRLQHLGIKLPRLVTAAGVSSPAAAAELLGVLSTLQCLTHLELVRVGCWQWPASSSFSALTASSQLQVLSLVRQGVGWRSSWRHIFPPNRPLHQLQRLHLLHVNPRLSADDLRCIASACPALQELNAEGASVCAQLTTLLQLPHLTKLQFGLKNRNVGYVARLTGLHSLGGNSKLTGGGLQQLAALRQLTELNLWQHGPTGTNLDPEPRASLTNWSPPFTICLHNKVLPVMAMKGGCSSFLTRQ